MNRNRTEVIEEETRVIVRWTGEDGTTEESVIDSYPGDISNLSQAPASLVPSRPFRVYHEKLDSMRAEEWLNAVRVTKKARPGSDALLHPRVRDQVVDDMAKANKERRRNVAVQANQLYADVFGIGPAVLRDWISAAMHRVFIRQYGSLFLALSRGGMDRVSGKWKKQFEPRVVNAFWSPEKKGTRQLVDQVLKDGLEHLAPLVYVMDMSVEEMRACVGRNPWKRVHSAKPSRISLMAMSIINRPNEQEPRVGVPAIQTPAREILPLLVDLPSSALSILSKGGGMFRNDRTDEGFWSLLREEVAALSRWKRLSRWLDTEHTLHDILRMESQLRRDDPYEYGLGEEWSLRMRTMLRWQNWAKVEKRHAWLTERVNERMRGEWATRRLTFWAMKRETFEGFYSPEMVSIRGEEDYAFRMLTTAEELLEEGQNLDHCVAGYWGDVSSKVSLIYAVRSDRSQGTLEVQLREGKPWIRQLRGYRNVSVSDDMMNAARLLVQKIRKVEVEQEVETDG